MFKRLSAALLTGSVLCALTNCRSAAPDRDTVVVLIENSPTSLDPRIGTDAVSEHLDELLFDGLVAVDANFGFKPALAERWEQPDPLTYIFHLRAGVRFQDGRALTARDVAWTITSMRDGTVVTPKANAYDAIERIETPNELTVVLHLKRADNSLLENLTTSALGIVPFGSGKEFAQHPIGTGAFKFVSAAIDQQVVMEANADSWSGVPKIKRLRFAVVPDANTRTLELEKGTADISVNPTTMDTLPVLQSKTNLVIEEAPGTVVQYLSFNTRDAILKDARVRRAIGFAVDRELMIKTLQRGHARTAESLLPLTHWAYWQSAPDDAADLDFNPQRAEKLLDDAGYRRGADGVRFHTSIKTSTDESARLLAAVLQQQLAQVGIALDIKSSEFASFYSDVVHGAFSIYTLRWIGGNEQPSIFSYAFATWRQPPKGGNRGFYSNPKLDTLLKDAEQSSDQVVRKQDYAEVQRILLEELPALNLWAQNAIVVHSKRISSVTPSPSGSMNFLRTAALVQ
jgi:peptide/nickel transport system substrate-binding protein